MNKYYGTQATLSDDIRWQLMPDESIIWQGMPKKKAFVVNSSMKMMPFALIWLLFDGMMIFSMLGTSSMVSSAMGGRMVMFMVPFFAVHLMPVWIWLSNTFKSFGRWKNTLYVITTHRVLIRNGLAGAAYESVNFEDIARVSAHVGSIDRMMGVGDVVMALDSGRIGDHVRFSILDVENYQYVYETIQQLVTEARMRFHVS